jgi:CubicO group peptidase (beta-lactamase class C family)
MSLNKKVTVILLIPICLLIGLRADKSFADQVKPEFWPTKQWQTSTPEAQGMDSKKLQQMDDFLENECPSMGSALVIRNGFIVFEKYYSGNENHTYPIWSVTKSVISALIGIALDNNYIESVDQKIVAIFPEYTSRINDTRVEKITIRHLLTMSSGFSTSTRGLSSMGSCFSHTMITEPGSEAYYNSCSSHLLSGIISKSTKMKTREFCQQNLFKPLGIEKPPWQVGIEGYAMGGYGLSMRTKDMAKIGYLYLNNGVWDNKQIIPAEWIKESTQKQSTISLEKIESSYGYQWWVGSSKGYSCFYAFGAGGQYIHVIPDLNVVVVFTANGLGLNPKHKGITDKFIIPSILKP